MLEGSSVQLGCGCCYQLYISKLLLYRKRFDIYQAQHKWHGLHLEQWFSMVCRRDLSGVPKKWNNNNNNLFGTPTSVREIDHRQQRSVLRSYPGSDYFHLFFVSNSTTKDT